MSNSPSFEDEAVLEFFETSTRNLLAAEAAAGVGHHVALSVVGTDRLPDSGYLRAKVAQEELIKAVRRSRTRSSTRRSSSSSSARIADAAHRRRHRRLPPALIQPDRGRRRRGRAGRVAVGAAAERHRRAGRPEAIRLDELVRRYLSANATTRARSITDVHARYFGTELRRARLIPGDDATHRHDAIRGLAQPVHGAGGLGRARSPARLELGGTMSTPGEADAFLHEFELTVRTELTIAETSQPEEEAGGVPDVRMLLDPDAERYEVALRSLLGAVEALEEVPPGRDS